MDYLLCRDKKDSLLEESCWKITQVEIDLFSTIKELKNNSSLKIGEF